MIASVLGRVPRPRPLRKCEAHYIRERRGIVTGCRTRLQPAKAMLGCSTVLIREARGLKTAALIVAAGRGTRASGPLPKQYARVGGVPVLARTLGVFLDHPAIDMVQVAIAPGDEALYAAAIARRRRRQRQAARSHRRRRHSASLRPQRPRRAGAARAGSGADPRCRPAVRHARCHRPRARGARPVARRAGGRSPGRHAQAGRARQPRRRHARSRGAVAGADPARLPLRRHPGRARSARRPPAATT